MIDTEVARRLVNSQVWHHDYEIIPGVRTNGAYPPRGLWDQLHLPDDMTGLSVADVGASNGFFSFECRRRGARVVAFDFRHRDNSAFALSQHINGMRDIEHHQINVLELTSERFGQFDIVLALGLLYHISDPYMGLANCSSLSKQRLLIESYCIDETLPKGLRAEPVMRFISDPTRFPEHGHVNNDRSNFWGFTSVCLERMVQDVGFHPERVVVNQERVLVDAERSDVQQELVHSRQNIAYGTLTRIPAGEDKNNPESWSTK